MMYSNLFSNILVPYDGSKFAKKAVKNAIAVSDRFESRVHLLSVSNVNYISPPGSLLGLTGTKSTKKLLEDIKRSTKKELENDLKEQISKLQSRGRTADYHIASGDVVEEILKYAKKKRVSLIIIGSQGLHGISKIKAMGSVSRKVSEFANCPVLIVR